ncbi:MAG: V0D/AC39 family V-type ATPase subunit, partial [Candidatus Bathyarchaeia archaeon]
EDEADRRCAGTAPSMSLGLTYAVVRSHALMADLLTSEQMRSLALSEDLEAFIEGLSETPYGRISVDADGDVSIALEKVFYRKFIERMTRVVDIAPRNIAEFLQTYYYMRFEVLNLKRILRGKFSGIPVPQIIDSLVPIEPYRAGDFEELAEAETLEEAVERLRDTPYSALEASMELCKEYDALWPLDLALNHLYAATVLRSLRSLPRGDRALVRRIVEVEADVENFLIAMKRRRASEEASRARSLEDLFPATYGIGLDRIREVIEAEEIKPVIEALGSPYSEILAPIYEGDVALIRTRLRRHIYRTARLSRSANDFGFNVIMAYLVFSEIEKDDLVGIGWGKAQGVPSEDVLKYLTIVEG